MESTQRRTPSSEPTPGHLRTVVLVPCFNEEKTIESVVRSFRKHLPEAIIFVYDNNSTDQTAAAAAAAGAVVRSERAQGKGSVVRRMFADIDADVYLMVDGDDTYDAESSSKLVEHLISGGYDLVNGERIHDTEGAYRFGHQFGNRLLTGLVAFFFGHQIKDMLSGAKAFSRRFVKSFPALSSGFDIETELTVHALEMKMPVSEHRIRYGERPPGSNSKLSTYRDGLKILIRIIRLLKEERPLPFFSLIGLLLVVTSVALSTPLLFTYLETGLVPRLPTALVSVGLVLIGTLSVVTGIILETVTRGRQELKRLFYLSLPPATIAHETRSDGT